MELNINGKTCTVDAEPDTPLLWVIRDDLGMTGTKYGCGLAQCGACSVLMDGAVVRSCVMPVGGMAGRAITTIEGVEQDEVGKRVVAAWVKHQVPQCGYCQSGQVMAATALLKHIPHPSDDEIAAAMINLCRCGTYNAIKAALHDLAGGKPGDASGARRAAAGAGVIAIHTADHAGCCGSARTGEAA
ncbi:(2Fe-2S)-binding protein [Bordetella genomosp. 13]|uniref:(2Fe-2S)-binding protein n=1 Tax=Bordetella genomosp. 13 TaxID=463040 RepID=UPI0011A6FA5D|nr:(2Fe-2S)-binding protein [Bordetella genomosp. 13]